MTMLASSSTTASPRPAPANPTPPPIGHENSRRLLLPILIALWCLTVVAGIVYMWKYSNAGGDLGRPPISWPADSRISRQGRRPTLVMFAHPHCPCTRASIYELARLMRNEKSRLDACVAFIYPDGMPRGWERTGLWNNAKAIPGVRVLTDVHGDEARLFDARTSGDVVLYDEQGRLVFHGGITPARDHAGDNTGRWAIQDIVEGSMPRARRTAVFGCPLFEEPRPPVVCSKETRP